MPKYIIEDDDNYVPPVVITRKAVLDKLNEVGVAETCKFFSFQSGYMTKFIKNNFDREVKITYSFKTSQQ